MSQLLSAEYHLPLLAKIDPPCSAVSLRKLSYLLLLLRYFRPWPWPWTLWPWHLTFDVEHLQYAVVKLYTKFERNEAIPGEVIAILIFDSITLNLCHVLCSALG